MAPNNPTTPPQLIFALQNSVRVATASVSMLLLATIAFSQEMPSPQMAPPGSRGTDGGLYAQGTGAAVDSGTQSGTDQGVAPEHGAGTGDENAGSSMRSANQDRPLKSTRSRRSWSISSESWSTTF